MSQYNTDTVKIATAIQFQCFYVPDRAYLAMPPAPKQQGLTELPSFGVEELEPHVLDALAKQWLDHLYARVGRGSPFCKVGHHE